MSYRNLPDRAGRYAYLLARSARSTATYPRLSRVEALGHFAQRLEPQASTTGMLQAIARAHRIGQNPHVSVYRFVIKDTMGDELECAKKMVIGARVCE